MTEAPACKCHDYPMLFNVDTRYRAGGFWRCTIKQRERSRILYHTRVTVRVRKRLLRLAHDRASIVQKLNQLHEEVVSLGAQS